MFSIIAAIGKNNELGRDGGLVFNIKEDMKFFREKTMGHKVVMGHNTWESLPKKLPGRENIVVSREELLGPDLVVHDLPKFMAKFKDSNEEIFVIGGGTIYLQFLPYAETIYLTEIDAKDEKATTFFPEFDKSLYFKTVLVDDFEDGIHFTISKYERKING